MAQARRRTALWAMMPGCRAALRAPMPPTLCLLAPLGVQGEPSVFEREAASMKGKAGQRQSKIQVAGKDYEHQDFCQVSTAQHDARH